MTTPRVRFAPSPTGALHLGGARTALYNWLFARQTGGTFLVRIEDTDRTRSTPEAEAQIWRTLRWLGMTHPENEPVIRQSERADRYAEVISILKDAGHLYPCPDATADEAGRVPLRFRMPKVGRIEFADHVRGDVSFDAASIYDPILVRSDGTATYNLAAAVDDWDMQITDVIRGEDHLSNTPIQIAVLTALGADIPRYGHLPMILGPDGAKLSKRHGAASVEEYSAYLPAALLNYLALLGGAGIDSDTILTMDDLVTQFSLDRVGSAPARFDHVLLDHMQGQHFRALSHDEWVRLYPGAYDAEDAYFLMHDKAVTWADETRLMQPFATPFTRDEDVVFDDSAPTILDAAITSLGAVTDWTEDSIGTALRSMADGLGLKPRKAIPVVQGAVMGQRFGVSVFKVAFLLGRDETLDRITSARKIAMPV